MWIVNEGWAWPSRSETTLKPDVGQAGTGDDPGEQLTDRFRMHRFAAGVGEDRVPTPDVVSVVALAIAPFFEEVFGVRVEFEAASAGACFGGELGGPPGECLTGAADRQLVQGRVAGPHRNPAISPRRIPVVAVRCNAG